MGKREIFTAIEFAAKAHAGKFRKGTKIPYMIHPLGVAKVLIENKSPSRVVIAGILHDTVEDTHVTLKDIKKAFGEEVARIVEGASEYNKRASWERRKQHTVEYLKTAPRNILLVSLADKIDNLRAMREDYGKVGKRLWTRFRRPKAKQRWYYHSLLEVFRKKTSDETIASLYKQFRFEVQKVFG